MSCTLVSCSSDVSPQDGCGPETEGELRSIWLNRKVSCRPQALPHPPTSTHMLIITLLREAQILPNHETQHGSFLPDKTNRSTLQMQNKPKDIKKVAVGFKMLNRSPDLFVTMLLLPLSQSVAGVLRSSLFLLLSKGTSR